MQVFNCRYRFDADFQLFIDFRGKIPCGIRIKGHVAALFFCIADFKSASGNPMSFVLTHGFPIEFNWTQNPLYKKACGHTLRVCSHDVFCRVFCAFLECLIHAKNAHIVKTQLRFIHFFEA